MNTISKKQLIEIAQEIIITYPCGCDPNSTCLGHGCGCTDGKYMPSGKDTVCDTHQQIATVLQKLIEVLDNRFVGKYHER